MIKPKASRTIISPKKSNFWARFLASQLLVVFLGLVFLVLIAVPLLRNYSKKRAVEREIAEVKQEIAEFENKNRDLSAMLDYLQSKDSLEEQARINLGLKKPGENVVVVKGVDLAKKNEAISDQKVVSNWHKWIDYFLNK